MGYMLRYNPAFTFLFRAVKEGWLGEITEVHGHMGKQASPGLRKDLSQYPGGGLFELACHLIDALVTVLGKPEEVHGLHLKTKDDAFIDNQLATFRYERALATIGSNHNDPFGGPRRQFSVIGTEGSIAIQPLEPPKLSLSLTKARGDFKRGTQNVPLPKTDGRYHDEFRDMAKIVRGEKKFAWNSAHDLAVQETLMRAAGMPLDI
jgi:predicted dehydrogenase